MIFFEYNIDIKDVIHLLNFFCSLDFYCTVPTIEEPLTTCLCLKFEKKCITRPTLLCTPSAAHLWGLCTPSAAHPCGLCTPSVAHLCGLCSAHTFRCPPMGPVQCAHLSLPTYEACAVCTPSGAYPWGLSTPFP